MTILVNSLYLSTEGKPLSYRVAVQAVINGCRDGVHEDFVEIGVPLDALIEMAEVLVDDLMSYADTEKQEVEDNEHHFQELVSRVSSSLWKILEINRVEAEPEKPEPEEPHPYLF